MQGTMMAGRLPHLSATAPHRAEPAKTTMLAQNKGVATMPGVQLQLLLQVGREQRPDRVVDAERCAHPQAAGQRVEEVLALEDGEQRRVDLGLPLGLQPLVLGPHFRLLDEEADPHDHQRRRDADPQQAAPADVLVEEAVGQRRQREAQAPRALQDAAHEAARARRPGFHGERRTGRPFRAHADAEQRAEDQQEGRRSARSPR